MRHNFLHTAEVKSDTKRLDLTKLRALEDELALALALELLLAPSAS